MRISRIARSSVSCPEYRFRLIERRLVSHLYRLLRSQRLSATLSQTHLNYCTKISNSNGKIDSSKKCCYTLTLKCNNKLMWWIKFKSGKQNLSTEAVPIVYWSSEYRYNYWTHDILKQRQLALRIRLDNQIQSKRQLCYL